MDVNHLQRRSASLDCDTIYWADILQSIREIPEEQGAVFYFPDGGDKPIYSYIKTDENAIVVDIQEKKAISNKANTGVYVFAKAELLRTWAAKNIDATRSDAVGEYYTSQLIAAMMREGLPFVGIQLAKKDFSCVGTPEQLQELLRQVKNVGETRVKTRRFCFDLDMTLVGVPEIEGNYATCPPIWKNIELVQQLYKAGHHIIIQTARKMRTHHGNVGSILADVGVTTFAQLTKYKIPFHGEFLLFSKASKADLQTFTLESLGRTFMSMTWQ
jgi:ADP-glucose pyrophosphorylase